MHELHALKDKLCAELETFANKEITASNLEHIDKLAHAAKNVAKLIESDSYSGTSYAGTYAMRAKRDAMGRYSTSPMLSELREMRKNAPDERTKIELDRFIERMETM